jgi:hypothetical protein
MMRRITMGALRGGRKFVGDLATDRWLLVSALCLVAAIRLGLWIVPVRVVGHILGWLVSWKPGVTKDPSLADRVARAVTRANRVVPGATCLTQALATQVLFERHGLPARLHIGVVVRAGGQAVQGHAWVESQGRIVIGGAMSGQWSPLLVVEGVETWSAPGRRPS